MAHRRDLLPLAAPALLAVPYLTLSLPFRQALLVQAAMILGITAGLALVGLLPGRAGFFGTLRTTLGTARLDRRLWIGAGLWTSAAAVGLASALAAGNDRSRVAGQLLALLLMPLGLLAGRLAEGEGRFRRVSRALVATALAASLLHFAVWAVAAFRGLPPARLYLENSVSIAGAVPLILVLLLALRPVPRWRGPALAALVLYLAGSGSRGAWLAAGLGAVVFLFLGPGEAPRKRRRWGPWLAAAGVFLAAVGGLALWLEGSRDNELPTSRPAELLEATAAGEDLAATARGGVAWTDDLHQRILVRRFPARPETAYRLRGWFQGGDRGRAYAALRWLGADGEVLARFAVDSRPAEAPRKVDSIAPSPAGTVAGVLLIGCRRGARGAWELERLEVHRLGPAPVAPILRQASYLRHRAVSLLDFSPARAWREGDALDSQGGGLADEIEATPPPRALKDFESMEFRVTESAELWRRFRGASPGRKLFGHGLGATFRVAGRELNYIHNLYAYLLFKLGLAGGVLLLCAAAVWLLALLATARRQPAEPAFAALAAIWTAYLAWGLVSPELLDFRLAPLFGMLLGALPESSKAASHEAPVRPSGGVV